MSKDLYFKIPLYNGDSIIDGLKSSVYGLRFRWPDNKILLDNVGSLEEIAKANGFTYEDKFAAHVGMLELLKAGMLLRVK